MVGCHPLISPGGVSRPLSEGTSEIASEWKGDLGKYQHSKLGVSRNGALHFTLSIIGLDINELIGT